MKKPASRLDDHNTALTSRQLIDHAGIEHEARALATQCLPAAHQPALATAETIVVELIEQRLAARAAYLDQEAQGIHEQITDLPDPRADRNLKHLAAHVLNETMKVFSANAPVIRQTIAAERNAKSEYNAWRDANALTHRQPVYPVSRVQHFALIVLLGMIEAAANAFMFLNATPQRAPGRARLRAVYRRLQHRACRLRRHPAAALPQSPDPLRPLLGVAHARPRHGPHRLYQYLCRPLPRARVNRDRHH
jgi:hypothetical protein